MKLAPIVVASFAMLVACSGPSMPETDLMAEGQRETAAPCTPANRDEILTAMATQPIVPPRFAAGLDLAGGDAWPGLRLGTVESMLCSGVPVSGAPGVQNPLSYFAFGDMLDAPSIVVGFERQASTLKFIQFNPSYGGSVHFKSRDGRSTYSFRAGFPIHKDGYALAIDWSSFEMGVAATELADALVATFAPELPPIDVDCRGARCLAQFDPGTGAVNFGARDIGMYLSARYEGQPGVSATLTPYELYMFPHRAALSPSTP